MIDETIKHFTHTINQTLLTSNTCNTCTNKVSNDPPHNDTPNLQPPKPTNIKSTNINKMHLPRDNITPSITTFNQVKQKKMDTDKLSHSMTLHNKILQSLNLHGLCKYDNSCQACLIEH